MTGENEINDEHDIGRGRKSIIHASPATDSELKLIIENAKLIKKLYDEALESEREFIEFMLARLESFDQIREFFKGAHIEFIDNNGDTYDNWIKYFQEKDSKHFKGRSSSHKSEGQQYSLEGNLVYEALFGTRKDSRTGIKYTWVQLERNPVGDYQQWTKSGWDFCKQFINLLRHFMNFIQYRITGRNIGPYGSSPHTENNNPIRIDLTKMKPEDIEQRRKLWADGVLVGETGKLDKDLLRQLAGGSEKPKPSV